MEEQTKEQTEEQTKAPGKKILLMEDDPTLAEILMEKLKQDGFNAMHAEDGEIGLKIALEEHPDLILLDIIMPKMDGIEVLKELRTDEWGQDVAIIILSNVGDEERVAEALENGVNEFLVKSNWDLDDVLRRIKERLGISQE